ncbi:MAG: type 4a pilus biogenesis protein PilO [Deltaproteobacteria bacterium]|jgi:Tfp pilus assembly protein PilO|nr:type 4a pilus biogenesis protein PilO [Deltaproteobacteria bacterium]
MAKAQPKSTQKDDNFFAKIAKLKPGARKGILFGGVAALLAGFYLLYYQPYTDQVTALTDEVGQLTQAVAAEQATINKHKPIAKFVKPVNDTFQYLSSYLTTENEIPRLMQIISDLGGQSGARVTLFAPKRPNLKPHYAEIDFSINLEGPFLNILKFLFTLSKMERIINIKSVTMDTPVMGANMAMSLSVRCEGSTYRLLTEEESKQVQGEAS